MALGISLSINIVLFVVAFRYRTDRLTDLSYALTFIVLAVIGLFAVKLSVFRLVLCLMVVVWALRLGGFLLFRIWHTGKDSRFDNIRNNFRKFGMFWVSQAFSVWIILLPATLALHAGKAMDHELVVAGFTVWLTGLAIETIADIQKYRFNAVAKNKGQWIESGVWHYSRHPNYLGEILVWIGTYLFASAALDARQRFVALAGPLFITILLLCVSGIPPLETSADERWGTIPAYKAYKKQTSILLLLPRKK